MTKWEDLLQKIVKDEKFLSEMNTHGFWKCDDNVIKYAKSKKIELSSSAPNYVSIDFLSKQSKILRNYDYYILRTGGGRFAILDEKKFPSSYLDLSISDGVQLETKEDPEFPELYKVFRKDVNDKSKQEDSALEFPNA